MAAFSSFQHHHSFPLDSSVLFLPNNPSPVDVNLYEPNNPLSPVPQFYQIQENPHNLDCAKKVFSSSGPGIHNNNNNEPSALSVTNKNTSATMDTSSMVTDTIYSCHQKLVTQDVNMDSNKSNKKRKPQVKREVKEKKQKKMKSDNEEKKKGEKEGPTGYIHVRARRGQATDSHSLAERVRREKISERMKLLQAIVPGCDKVTGKALMLDEIINYVQSLQNQVEFLSMKLASVNPMYYDFGIDSDSFMVRPDQACSPTATNNYPFPDNSANFFLFQQSQSQIPNVLPQESRQGLWEVDELRHKNIIELGIEQHPLFFPLI